MEATHFSETSVDFQRTTRSYIPEDRTLHNHRYENLKSYNYYLFPCKLHSPEANKNNNKKKKNPSSVFKSPPGPVILMPPAFT
jgi:hypothetical protein